jgi:hypothetical protein
MTPTTLPGRSASTHRRSIARRVDAFVVANRLHEDVLLTCGFAELPVVKVGPQQELRADVAAVWVENEEREGRRPILGRRTGWQTQVWATADDSSIRDRRLETGPPSFGQIGRAQVGRCAGARLAGCEGAAAVATAVPPDWPDGPTGLLPSLQPAMAPVRIRKPAAAQIRTREVCLSMSFLHSSRHFRFDAR